MVIVVALWLGSIVLVCLLPLLGDEEEVTKALGEGEADDGRGRRRRLGDDTDGEACATRGDAGSGRLLLSRLLLLLL